MHSINIVLRKSIPPEKVKDVIDAFLRSANVKGQVIFLNADDYVNKYRLKAEDPWTFYLMGTLTSLMITHDNNQTLDKLTPEYIMTA